MHAGLAGGVRLTRREWCAVRGSLGRPRRLSLQFLHQERARLEAYRLIVRAQYDQARPLPRAPTPSPTRAGCPMIL